MDSRLNYSAYKDVNAYDPISVLTIVNKCLRKTNIKRRKVKEVDNPLKQSIDTDLYLKAYHDMFVYRRKNGISSEGMELLVYAYLVFMNSSEGISSLRVCKTFNRDVHSELQSMRNKLNTLCRNGHLLKVGKTVNGGTLYIPSVESIEGLKNIFK